jgi:hypothetical protein
MPLSNRIVAAPGPDAQPVLLSAFQGERLARRSVAAALAQAEQRTAEYPERQVVASREEAAVAAGLLSRTRAEP